jgi:transcriptional regulator with XRE-family HTH domain
MSPNAHSDAVAAFLASPAPPRVVVRVVRTALNWSQAELGRRSGYSRTQVSRWETGRLPLVNTTLLHKLADVLNVPPALFGLGDTSPRSSLPSAGRGSMVKPITQLAAEEADQVRRRTFLQLAALSGTSPAWLTSASAVDPAAALTENLGDVLLGTAPVGYPTRVSTLSTALSAARQEFTSCHYLPLATRLPALISTAEATAAQNNDPAAHQLLAESYSLATRALIKLEATGLEWISADRALRAAHAADSAITLAEAQRLVASVARRAGHHARAEDLTLAAASHLDVTSPRPSPEHVTMYGTLHLSAAYAAARAGNRHRAHDLLTEAENMTHRLTDDPPRHEALLTNVISHKVSIAYLLGDAGTALAHAHSVPLQAFPTTERRARLLVDTAQAWAHWDKPDRAYITLLAAERAAPGEVHTRSTVRRLIAVLLRSPKQAAMPGLTALARRAHGLPLT